MGLLVPDGPHRRAGQQLNPSAFFKVFANRRFRVAAFGYFGHMWELYAFWAFVPLMLEQYVGQHGELALNNSMLAFLIVAIGAPACVIGGLLSQQIGAKKVALTALICSGICCLASPLFFEINSPLLFLTCLFFWGFMVIPDSPLFSSLVAQNAEANVKGTALTIVNCLGFAITIVSIQLLSLAHEHFDRGYIYLILAIGPLAGLLSNVMERKNQPQ